MTNAIFLRFLVLSVAGNVFELGLIAGLLATFVAFSIIFFVCFLNYLQAI